MKQESIVSFKNEYCWLSNFFTNPLVYEEISYPTLEHAFQAAKTNSIEDRIKIASLLKPGQAKVAGRKVKLRSNWDFIKLDIMKELLVLKFSDLELKEKLMDTQPSILIEGNKWHDNFYGSCICSKCGNRGKNNLGKLLMEIRNEQALTEGNK